MSVKTRSGDETRRQVDRTVALLLPVHLGIVPKLSACICVQTYVLCVCVCVCVK